MSRPSPPALPPRRPTSTLAATERPPLPPRPVARATSRRKPVPALDEERVGNTDVGAGSQSGTSTAKPITSLHPPPIVPPRLYRLTPAPLALADEKDEAIARYHTPQNSVTIQQSRTILAFRPRQASRRRLWLVGGAALLVLIIIVAVVAAVTTRDSGRGGSNGLANTDNGGHPLSIEDGGVDIGQPGDIAKYGTGSSDHFVLQMNRSTLVGRFDSIVSPGQVSSHVHRFYGSSLVDEVLRNATDASARGNCSTTPVQDDKSLYWVPQLYYRSPDNGSLAMVPIRYHAAYYFQKAPTGQPIHPFPDNYNVVAGNPFRREVDPNDMSQRALWWQCFRGGGNDSTTAGFPDTPCSGGLISLLVMPSCWDGIADPDADYSSHVTYPIDAPNGHQCPSDYPNKFMTVQFETNFAVGDFPFNGPGEVTWVLANGDATGYGIHGDFVNGWKPEVQQAIIRNCRYMNKTDEYPTANDLRNCPALTPSIDFGAAARCRFQGQIIDEAVGHDAPLTLLPGCNDIWEGIGGKPPCPPGRQEGNESMVKVDPGQWLREEPYVS